jgi:5'-3' exoribonuclease 1
MGIPAYFSYIVRNHLHILHKLSKTADVANFYLDANSIIYDCVNEIDFENCKDADTKLILTNVCSKIINLLNIINPTQNVIIAFDGVAPLAKLNQQRSRRYKSRYQASVMKNIFKKTHDGWNTTAITPGTIFMSQLNEFITKQFIQSKFPNCKIILTLSDEPGEGEHKIFEYIRQHPDEHENYKTVVYGLDADLIMLCINHLPVCKDIHLFRETPNFIKNLNCELDPNESYILDIPELANQITLEMNNNVELTNIQQKNRIYDYIFLCFFLGNDFMPHFPALNIRTNGITKLINAYKSTVGSSDVNLTDGKKIYWKNVRKFVDVLAGQEESYIKQEAARRRKYNNYTCSENTPEEKWKKIENMPQTDRTVENYINVNNVNWEDRYYQILFHLKIDDVRRNQICINYLEGLEWTMKYYTSGCADWRWSYQYHYPPLLVDLVKFVPYFDTEFIIYKNPQPIHPLVQLCYVLPKECLHLLPSTLYAYLMENHIKWYRNDCAFLWAYCKYFWESHVLLPEIDINELEPIVDQFINK